MDSSGLLNLALFEWVVDGSFKSTVNKVCKVCGYLVESICAFALSLRSFCGLVLNIVPNDRFFSFFIATFQPKFLQPNTKFNWVVFSFYTTSTPTTITTNI